jgi:glycosyltransferase involved in cell wall biosynthesis
MFKKGYVLVLPSWYPSKADVFNGDFNQRTVHVLSTHIPQVVIYVVPYNLTKKLKVEREVKENVITIRGYFPKSNFKIIDLFIYLKVYFKLIKKELKQNGKPLYIHTYVFFPAGLLSYYFAKKLKVKNVLTEHWSIIYPSNEFSISKRFLPFKLLLSNTLKSFDLILPVVEALKEAISHWAPKVEKVVISNVVDTSLFYFRNDLKSTDFTFLHVSSLEKHKNPQGILEAFKCQLMLGQSIKLKFIGPLNAELLQKVDECSYLRKNVEFLGEMQNYEVAFAMQKSHVLIMNSCYESQPCVILEALCCGLPIVTSDVGGISEIINDCNGILFQQGNLSIALGDMIKFYRNFNNKMISENAIDNFSCEAISIKTINVLMEKNVID